MSGTKFCQECDGYTRPWCGHGSVPPPGPCAAFTLLPLITDEMEGEKPHAFPCLKRAGHDGTHLAHVTWFSGEDDR